jgi:hypothetical protein
MLQRIFPERIDNPYQGHQLALWLFALLVLIKCGISLNSIFIGAHVASTADGIPLDTFTSAGAQTVVSLFALLGFANFMLCLLCILVLLRHRSLISLMFALFILDYLGRRLILYFLPIPRTGAPLGSIVNLVLFTVMIVGLALSLWKRADPQGNRDHSPDEMKGEGE